MKASDNRLAGHVKSHVENGIAVIEFFHPSHNSLPGRLLAELREAITAAGKNPEVAVIVLQSGGERTFCAGASFEELISIEDEDSGRRFFMGFAGVINACRKCPPMDPDACNIVASRGLLFDGIRGNRICGRGGR